MEGFMLAYAPRRERRRLQPSALALIIGAHALAIVAVMTARMDLPKRWAPTRTDVTFVPLPPEPVPDPLPQTDPRPSNRAVDSPQPIVDSLPSPGPIVDALPQPPDPGPLFGNGSGTSALPLPVIRTGPRFVTPDSAIRPPYPEAKRQLEQEATLRLRLSIDERGRVVAVEPIGRADPAFLAAARRHILKAWRYQPAMEGEKAIASTTVITLKFELD
jgi:protein TonB